MRLLTRMKRRVLAIGTPAAIAQLSQWIRRVCVYFSVFGLGRSGGRLRRRGIDGLAQRRSVPSCHHGHSSGGYDRQEGIGREVVALFQRDAQTKGAERAILVTLGKFSEPARRAANATAPTVDLIDGSKLADLVLEQGVGIRVAPRVNEAWFDRFD